MSKIREYHQSEINTYLKCGKQWEFRYVKGIRTPPKAALTIGSSVDAAVTRNLIQKITSKADLPVGDVLDVFSTDFDIRAKETEWDEDDTAGEAKDVGVKLVKLHHEKVAPKIEPATVQEEFTIKTDQGYNLGGKIDLTEQSGVVADTKTSGKRFADDAVFRAVQPAMYDLAYEALNDKPSAGFRYDVLIKKKTPELQQVEAKVTAADRQWLWNTLNDVHHAISAGVALPAPEGSWVCSEKWCGYWHMCKGKNEKS